MRKLLALLFFTLSASAQTISLHGWADAYRAWNSDNPHPALNFFSGVGTTAHRANQLALNVAAIDIAKEPKPFGFHVTLVGGDSADVVHAGEPHRGAIRNLYQASMSYNAGKLGLEAGIYPSHIGFETFFSKDNWNYTRGWLAELSPYYESGIKASYAINDRWSAQLHGLNGWQNATAHARKAIGTQLAFSGARLSASFNTYADSRRKFGDLVATWKTTDALTLGGSLDHGHDPGAQWMGAAAFARYALNDRHAFAVRAERFRDPQGSISGTPQRLREGTLTYEIRQTRHVLLKLEARRDHYLSTTQTLAIASAVVMD